MADDQHSPTRPYADLMKSPSELTGVLDEGCFERGAAATGPRLPYRVLERWSGHVLSVGDDVFAAALTDVTGGGVLDGEEAEIPMRRLSGEDRAALAVGAFFTWTIDSFGVSELRLLRRSAPSLRRRLS